MQFYVKENTHIFSIAVFFFSDSSVFSFFGVRGSWLTVFQRTESTFLNLTQDSAEFNHFYCLLTRDEKTWKCKKIGAKTLNKTKHHKEKQS